MIKPSANYDISVGYYQLSRAWLIILSSFVLLSLHGSRDFATTALFIPLCNRGNVPSCKLTLFELLNESFLNFFYFLNDFLNFSYGLRFAPNYIGHRINLVVEIHSLLSFTKWQTLQVSSSHAIIEKFQATKMCLVTSVKLITVEV